MKKNVAQWRGGGEDIGLKELSCRSRGVKRGDLFTPERTLRGEKRTSPEDDAGGFFA